MSSYCYKVKKGPLTPAPPPSVNRRKPAHILLTGADFTYATEDGIIVGTHTDSNLSGFRDDTGYEPAIFAYDYNNSILKTNEVAFNSGLGQIKIKLNIELGAESHFKVDFNW